MSNELGSITGNCELEHLLRESAGADEFCAPPENLVRKAIASITAQAALPRTAGGVVTVLSLAAASLIVASMAPHRTSNNTTSIEARTSPVEMTAAEPAAAAPMEPPTRTSEYYARQSPAPKARQREPIRMHYAESPQSSMWTDTVVTTTEQGIVLPIVTEISDENGATSTAPAVAVVPLGSSVAYTSYEDESPDR